MNFTTGHKLHCDCLCAALLAAMLFAAKCSHDSCRLLGVQAIGMHLTKPKASIVNDHGTAGLGPSLMQSHVV